MTPMTVSPVTIASNSTVTSLQTPPASFYITGDSISLLNNDHRNMLQSQTNSSTEQQYVPTALNSLPGKVLQVQQVLGAAPVDHRLVTFQGAAPPRPITIHKSGFVTFQNGPQQQQGPLAQQAQQQFIPLQAATIAGQPGFVQFQVPQMNTYNQQSALLGTHSMSSNIASSQTNITQHVSSNLGSESVFRNPSFPETTLNGPIPGQFQLEAVESKNDHDLDSQQVNMISSSPITETTGASVNNTSDISDLISQSNTAINNLGANTVSTSSAQYTSPVFTSVVTNQTANQLSLQGTVNQLVGSVTVGEPTPVMMMPAQTTLRLQPLASKTGPQLVQGRSMTGNSLAGVTTTLSAQQATQQFATVIAAAGSGKPQQLLSLPPGASPINGPTIQNVQAIGK